MSRAEREHAIRDAGDAGARLGGIRWEAHALGAPARWPERLSGALELCLAAPEPTALLWGAERFLFYNDACAPLLGSRHPAALARELAGGWPELGSSDVETALAEVVTHGRGVRVEARLRVSGSTERVVAASLIPIRAGGAVAGVLVAFAERPAARQETGSTTGERSLRLADAAPAILWLTDATDRCIFLSRGWYEYTGVAEGDDPDREWTRALHPDDREAAKRAFVAASARREPFSIDFRLRRADGEHRWVIDRGRPRHDEDGRFAGYVGSVIDVHERKLAEQELQVELEDTQRLQAASARLIREGDVDALLREILDAAVAVMHADCGTVQLLDPESGELALLASRGLDEAFAAHFHRVRAGTGTSCGAALRRGKRVVVPDVESDPELASDPAALEALRTARIHAGQSTPLVTRAGVLVGMLSTHWRRVHEPVPRELRLLDLLARQAADLLERRRAEEELRAAAERFRVLAEVSETLLAADEPQAVADALCARVAEHVGCECYLNYLVDERSGRLRLNAWGGITAEQARAGEWLEFGESLCGRVALDGTRVVRESVQTSTDADAAAVRSFGIDAYACNPLIVQGRTLGTLAFGSRGRARFSEDDLAVMAGVASQVASAMERVRTSRRIASVARRFRILADAAPVMLWLSDANGLITFVSRGWSEFTGRPAASALGEGWLDVVHPEDRERLRQRCHASQSAGEAYSEHRLLRADGVYRRVIANARPRPDVEDEPRGYVGAIVDIDEQKRTQAVLAGQRHALELALHGAETDEVLAAIVRTAEDETAPGTVAAILMADDDGRHLRCGAAAGLPARCRAEIDRLAYEPFLPAARTPPGGDDELGGAQWEAVREVVAREGLHAGWWRPLVAADGALLGLFALFHPARGTAHESGARAASAEDRAVAELLHTTAAIAIEHGRIERSLLEAESNRQRFVSLVENSADFIGMADLDGEVIYVNPAGRKLVGRSAAGYAPSTVDEYLAPDSRARVRAEVMPAVLHAGQWQGELAFREAPSGREIPMVVAMFQIPGAHGASPACVATVARDVSERKAAEHERTQLLESERSARGAAERANRVKDEFLATLSHELRTPLHAITGWTEILGHHETSKEVAHGIEVIARNAEALKQLISDLLDMSRIVTGKVRLDSAPVDLGVVIADALESVRLTAEAKGIRLEARIEPLGEAVIGDRGRLQQVVWNLLTNALKFTGRGGRVGVGLERGVSSATITITDDGIGIRSEFLPQLFDRFRQADSSTAREHGGLGIGLALVKQLTELHGGRVSAESAGPGQGATLRVELPLRAAPPAVAGERTVELRPAPPRRAPPLLLAELSILLVDDDPDALETVAWLLEERGAHVTTAASAEAALEALERARFHLLLADIGMPGVDGYELLRRARVRGHDVPAVALTAFARHEDRALVLAAGFAAHLAKPAEVPELVELVARHAARTA